MSLDMHAMHDLAEGFVLSVDVGEVRLLLKADDQVVDSFAQTVQRALLHLMAPPNEERH